MAELDVEAFALFMELGDEAKTRNKIVIKSIYTKFTTNSTKSARSEAEKNILISFRFKQLNVDYNYLYVEISIFLDFNYLFLYQR